MSITDVAQRFAGVRAALVKERPSGVGDAAIDWLTYVIGLLPGIGAPAQIGNKIINDGRLKAQLESIQAALIAADRKIGEVQAGIDRVSAIAVAAASREEVQQLIADFAQALRESVAGHESEFSVRTTDWSRQDVLNTIIEASRVRIEALNNSTNVVRGTTVSAKNTELRAHGNSYNVIDGSSFKDGSGSVSMHGITQAGNINVTGNSVGFGDGGALIFGPPPDLLTANCPACNAHLEVRRAQLRGVSRIRCHNCLREFPFSLPG